MPIHMQIRSELVTDLIRSFPFVQQDTVDNSCIMCAEMSHNTTARLPVVAWEPCFSVTAYFHIHWSK